jgi:hypothetical protein
MSTFEAEDVASPISTVPWLGVVLELGGSNTIPAGGDKGTICQLASALQVVACQIVLHTAVRWNPRDTASVVNRGGQGQPLASCHGFERNREKNAAHHRGDMSCCIGDPASWVGVKNPRGFAPSSDFTMVMAGSACPPVASGFTAGAPATLENVETRPRCFSFELLSYYC